MTEPFRLTPPPDDSDTSRGIDAPPRKNTSRQPRYWRHAGEWVGFGPDLNTQPDLFESVYRFGWWRVAVCKVCLVTAIRNASGLLDQMEALMTQPRKRVGK